MKRPTSVAGTIVAIAEKYPGDGDLIIEAAAFADLVAAARAEVARACHVAGCEQPHHCDGLCKRHFARAGALGFLTARVDQLRQLAEGK